MTFNFFHKGKKIFVREFFFLRLAILNLFIRVSMASLHREAIQKQIEQDWANREYIELITGSIKRITDFLNSFGNNTIYYLI